MNSARPQHDTLLGEYGAACSAVLLAVADQLVRNFGQLSDGVTPPVSFWQLVAGDLKH